MALRVFSSICSRNRAVITFRHNFCFPPLIFRAQLPIRFLQPMAYLSAFHLIDFSRHRPLISLIIVRLFSAPGLPGAISLPVLQVRRRRFFMKLHNGESARRPINLWQINPPDKNANSPRSAVKRSVRFRNKVGSFLIERAVSCYEIC